MKRILPAMLLVLMLLCTACTPLGEPQESITGDALKKRDALEAFIQTYQGAFVDSDHAGYRTLDKLFGWKVLYADLRGTAPYTIYFSTGPEMTRALCYCPDDRCVIDDAHVVTAECAHIRVEGIGIGGKGYADCTRIAENWFYVDAYYPT